MLRTVKCVTEGCRTTHVLVDAECEDRDGAVFVSLYRGKCPACRERYDRMLAEVRAVEGAQAGGRPVAGNG